MLSFMGHLCGEGQWHLLPLSLISKEWFVSTIPAASFVRPSDVPTALCLGALLKAWKKLAQCWRRSGMQLIAGAPCLADARS